MVFFRLSTVIFLGVFLFMVHAVSAADTVNISGNVRFLGQPVCGLVLANGRHMFSCNANIGTYNLDVPLDANGEITLFSFVSGLSPFKVVLTAAQAANYDITMTLLGANGLAPTISYDTAASSQDGWAYVWGTVETWDFVPLCGLVLANGQHMFSCGDSNGIFNLEVPLDPNGQITLFGFVSDSQPYQTTFSGPEPSSSGDPAEGIWIGSMSETGGGVSEIGLLLQGGRIIAYDEDNDVVYDGTYTLNGDQATTTATLYTAEGAQFGTATLSLTADAQQSLTGTYTSSLGNSGTISSFFSEDYNKPASLSLLSGTWRMPGPPRTVDLTIGDTGAFSSVDSNGCNATGAVSVINPSHNLYGVTVTVTSCDALDGSYTGFAALFDENDENDRMEVFMTNGTWLMWEDFYRQ